MGHVTDNIGDGAVFQLELKDRNYVLRTSTVSEAEKWMYKLRLLRDEARSSSIPEETAMDTSTRESEKTRASGGQQQDLQADGEWSKANIQISGGRAEEKKSCCVIS